MQEGSIKSKILLPPMPSSKNLVSVLSLVWRKVDERERKEEREGSKGEEKKGTEGRK